MSATAQVACQNQKIVFDAVPADINYRDNTASFRDVEITQCDTRVEGKEANVKGGLDFANGELTISGDVRITAEGGRLQSDKAVVTFQNNLISRATVTGSPAQFEQKRKDGNIARGRANTMDYETATGIVSFRENAWLTPDGCNEITGPSLAYNVKSQSAQPVPGSDGRIRITIQPKTGAGSPCTNTETTPKP